MCRASRRAARRRKEEREAKTKLILEILFLLVVMVGSALYQMHKMAVRSKQKLEQDTLLNATTQQVSQIIDNVRQAYAIYSEEKEFSMERLIELGVIPESIVDRTNATETSRLPKILSENASPVNISER